MPADRPCCPIGRRGDVASIDASLRRLGDPGAESLSSLAARVGVNKGSLHRHREHLHAGVSDSCNDRATILQPAETVRNTVEVIPAPYLSESDPEADGVLGQARSLKSRAQKLLKRLEDGDDNVDFRGASGLLREIRSCIELQARILGELRASAPTQVNVYTSPDWIRTRDRLLDALAPYPAALEAVIVALQDQPQVPPTDRSLN